MEFWIREHHLNFRMNQRVATFKLISNGNHCSHAGHQNCHWVVIILLLNLTSKYFDHCLLHWRISNLQHRDDEEVEGVPRRRKGIIDCQFCSANTNTFLCGAVQSIQNTRLLKIISFLILFHGWKSEFKVYKDTMLAVFFSSINFLLNDFILHPFMKGVLTNADNSENYWLFISVPPCRRRSSSKSQIFSLHHRPPFQGRLVSRLWIFCLFCWERKETNIVSLVMENKMSSI